MKKPGTDNRHPGQAIGNHLSIERRNSSHVRHVQLATALEVAEPWNGRVPPLHVANVA